MSEAKGGSYVINDKGERTLAEVPTRDHPEGNAPRPAPDGAVVADDSKDGGGRATQGAVAAVTTNTAGQKSPADKTATGPSVARGPRPDPGAETKRS